MSFSEEVVISVDRFVHNLVAGEGMSKEDIPLLTSLIKKVSERHFPKWDQTS